MSSRNESTGFQPENEPVIMTLSVKLLRGMYCEDDWMADIELANSEILEELHFAILNAVGFDDDHSFCFFVARTDSSGDRVYYDDENELIFTKTLAETFPLPKRKSLFYLFDWGDEWVFKVSKSRKSLHAPVDGTKYPRVVSESGIKPEQYPSFEEDED